MLAHFTGDGRADLLLQRSNGQLVIRPATGGVTFASEDVVIGAGWQPARVERIIIGDFTGDGKVDIGVQETDGELLVRASTGNPSTGSVSFAGNVVVGRGWQQTNVTRIR